MRDPDRLLKSSGSEVERLLLSAGRERAPRGAKRRALAAATGVVAASALTAGNAAGAAVAGKASMSATTLLSLKWIVVVGVASAGVVTGTVAVHAARAERATRAAETVPVATTRPHLHISSSPAQVPPPAAAAAATITPDPVAPLPAPALPSPPAALAAAPTALVISPRTAAPAAKASAPASSNAAAELAMLDQARGAVRDGEPARGLSILDAYASRFPHGIMAPEASIVRIEALVGAGDRDDAKRAGDAFLRANPSSPYAPRIESLVGPTNP
jgi:hypothetical protein